MNQARRQAYGGRELIDLLRQHVPSDFDPEVEVCQTWLLPESDTTSLLDSADLIDGLKYLPLGEVIAYKRMLGRAKDQADLFAVEEHLNHDGSQPQCRHKCVMLLSGSEVDGGHHGNPTAPGKQDRARRGLPAD